MKRFAYVSFEQVVQNIKNGCFPLSAQVDQHGSLIVRSACMDRFAGAEKLQTPLCCRHVTAEELREFRSLMVATWKERLATTLGGLRLSGIDMGSLAGSWWVVSRKVGSRRMHGTVYCRRDENREVWWHDPETDQRDLAESPDVRWLQGPFELQTEAAHALLASHPEVSRPYLRAIQRGGKHGWVPADSGWECLQCRIPLTTGTRYWLPDPTAKNVLCDACGLAE